MLRLISVFSLLILVAGLGLWASGALDGVSVWAAQWQREVQTSMARGLRALRAGEPGALAALLTICFSYGFFHAVGPGHGKVLIGGYAMASRATLWRMSAVALLSSLAQGASAVLLVLVGFLALNLTRQQMVGLAEDWFADASYVAIALIGLWLLVRGVRKLMRWSAGQKAETDPHHGRAVYDHDHHGHDHHDHADHVCPSCGHAHAPGLHEVEAAGSWRELAVLIAGIAIR
ncbi:nickel/cobalt transporter, partial [Aliiroseovarius marinus]|uniref:nickel/cobalt transporter n=1 Tax=Aliiroseovarius marinus TaxID=2500159 RepID=UPI003D7C99B9